MSSRARALCLCAAFLLALLRGAALGAEWTAVPPLQSGDALSYDQSFGGVDKYGSTNLVYRVDILPENRAKARREANLPAEPAARQVFLSINCAKKTFCVNNADHYDAARRLIPAPYAGTGWQPIPPGSEAERFHRLLCPKDTP